MGLGKTVTTLALILSRPGRQGSNRQKTLIIAPLALLDQWHNEIQEKCDHQISVLVYHGPSRKRGVFNYVFLMNRNLILEWSKHNQYAEIVLTTYDILGKECIPDKNSKDMPLSSPLLDVSWRRIILGKLVKCSSYADNSFR